MKRFEFPLDSALRWRKAIADVRKAEAIERARAVADAEARVVHLETEQAEAANHLARQAEGAGLAAYAAYLERSRRNIVQARARAGHARAALEAARNKLIEADRNARLIEKLREERFSEWRRETDRQIENFAAESFLNRR